MKRLFYVATIALMTLCVACNDSNDGVVPSIEITAVGSTSSTIEFVINAQNASKCAYMLYDGENISAEAILKSGVATKGGLIKIKNLEPKTKYYIAAAASNGSKSVMADPITITTKESSGGNTPLPDNGDAEDIVISKTQDGRWYEPYNYYVTFVRDNGDRIILDFYTIDETMSSYLPYGQYTLDNTSRPFTIHCETSLYVPAGVEDEDGYFYTDGYVSVDVNNGYYSIYFMLTYDENGVKKSVQTLYNGLMSGASVPEGDNTGVKKLIEVLDVGSSFFKFRINAEEGEYWRCSVVDKRVYDQTASNPGAWVVTYGFMLQGALTFDWRNGEMCEHVPGYMMNVSSSTDYLILAALMDYSEGKENSLLSGVEVVQVRTTGESAGSGSVDVNIKEVNKHDILFDCTLGEDVWCCYMAMMKTAHLQEIKDGNYALAGYSSYEECMLSLIPGLSHDSMRQFLESQVDYRWDYLNYNTSYTICIKVVDKNNGANFIELEPFTTSY